LQRQGVSVLTYPLTVQLVELRQLLGTFRFAITGPPGVYTVLSSTDLAVWNELGAVTNSLGTVVFTDVTAHLSPRKFYRARSPCSSTLFEAVDVCNRQQVSNLLRVDSFACGKVLNEFHQLFFVQI